MKSYEPMEISVMNLKARKTQVVIVNSRLKLLNNINKNMLPKNLRR